MNTKAAKAKCSTSRSTRSAILQPKVRKSIPQPGNRKRQAAKADLRTAATAAVTRGRISKQETLIELMKLPGGGTLESLMAATGWQAHSVRGVISGVLRKKLGLTVDLVTNSSGERAYRIAS